MEQQINIYELAESYFKDSKDYIVFWCSHDDLLINYFTFKDKEHFEKNFKIQSIYNYFEIIPINKVDGSLYLIDGENFYVHDSFYLIKDGKMV